MKATLLIIIGCLGLLICGYSFSCGSDNQFDCQQSSCAESDNKCQCTDVNAGKNPCISKTDYCHYFGNVGANDLPPF